MAVSVVSLFVWAILMTPASTNNTERHFQAKRVTYQLDAIPRREMLATYNNVPSSIGCAQYCLENVGCLSFFHSPNNGLCILCKLNLLPETAYFWRTLKGVHFYTAVTNVCPVDEGYVYESTLDICFRLSSDVKTWLEAVDSCAQERAGLFRPNSWAKIKYMEDLLKASDELKTRWYHMGASDAVLEGTWVWWTGEQMDANITNWIPGSPDNYKGNQNCMAMDPRSSHMWNDISCETNIFYYICEKILI